jgi:hypothetical protein
LAPYQSRSSRLIARFATTVAFTGCVHCALPVALMIVALVPATLAVPRAQAIHFLAMQ